MKLSVEKLSERLSEKLSEKLEFAWCSCHCLRVHISCTLRQSKVSHSDVKASAADLLLSTISHNNVQEMLEFAWFLF